MSGQASSVLSTDFDPNYIIADAVFEAFLHWLEETCTGALLPAGTLALAGVRLGWRRTQHDIR